jgi:predicted TIM-barrel enzyme
VADVFIVGTSIKKDQQTLNPVDPDRAAALVRAFETGLQA